MWAFENTVYQIYPLGFCGAPFENDEKLEHRILHVLDFIDHLKKLGVKTVLFNPVFSSDTHGYNTRDYLKIDERLGTNDDFKKVCDALHEAGMKVVLDGVFNHVGRGCPQFQDVLKNRENSRYLSWFNINLGGNDGYNDGLWYEGWEGNYDLVKLNLNNPEVTEYLCSCALKWIEEFDIDGLRLDVAYCLKPDFIRMLRGRVLAAKADFWLVGEMIGGDYKRVMGEGLCDSATNYECYKGLFSSFNSLNMFEICHSLLRQFGKEAWCLYRGAHLLSFVDNHDVSRIASILTNVKHLPLIYTFMFTMPGIPSVYYGSEWGEKADKKQGDPALRPYIEKPSWNELTEHISKLTALRNGNEVLSYGDFRTVVLQNKSCVFERKTDNGRILTAINADGNPVHLDGEFGGAKGCDLITGEEVSFAGGLNLPAYAGFVVKME